MSDDKNVEGGELIARTLRAAGVSTIFALHGGHLESFYKGCIANGLELIDFRHEASAGHAAEAYARVTGELGICVVTAGPGFANALPAILNAYVDASPTLFVIGAPPLRERETNELQGGFDQLAIARASAKWAVSISNVERIPDLLAQAVRRACTGKRGPVVVEVPIDVLHGLAREDRVKPPAGLLVQPHPAPSPVEVRAVRELVLQAERPVVIVGGDARFTGAADTLPAFVETTRIPVFAGKRGLGILPAGHPYDGHDAANLAALADGPDRPDLVLLIGTRMGLFLGGGGASILPRDAHIVQVYSDPAELGRIRSVDVAIASDSGTFLDNLTASLRGESIPDWSDWASAVVDLQHRHDALYPEVENERGIHPFHVASTVAAVAGTAAIFAIDGGEAGQWAAQAVKIDGPGRVITTGYFGGLGVAPGYAIGAQIAAPDRRVVVMTGDGSFGFHVQELDTMVHRGLPIVTVVLNNQIWGMSIHGQQIMYGSDYSVISRLPGRNYARIAQGFGAHAERVTSYAELGPALKRAFAAQGPAVVEVLTDPDVVSPGLIAMLGTTDPAIAQIVVPYYENIPL
jgi:acetolactate synthase-1/2/3 large subunit